MDEPSHTNAPSSAMNESNHTNSPDSTMDESNDQSVPDSPNSQMQKKIDKELENYQKDLDELSEINKKQEERIHNLETKSLQLANLYFVFQGVILSSSSSSSSKIRCKHWWVPFLLSLQVAIINLVALCLIVFKHLRLSEELDRNLEDIDSLRVQRSMIPQMRRVQPVESLQGEGSVERWKPDPFTKWGRRILSLLAIGIFVGFSIVILIGCHSILCDDDDHEK